MNKIEISTIVKSPISKVWEYFTLPEHIIKWNFAHESWCCPKASNHITPGGSFNWRMEAKDGSAGFDLIGTYDEVEKFKNIKYHLEDGREVQISFIENENELRIIEKFEPEKTNPEDLQRAGWQAILDQFKKYVESN